MITIDDDLRSGFTHAGKVPASVIVVSVETIYHQCSKAVVRSKLWDPESHVPRESLPTTGQLMERLTAGETDAAAGT